MRAYARVCMFDDELIRKEEAKDQDRPVCAHVCVHIDMLFGSCGARLHMSPVK